MSSGWERGSSTSTALRAEYEYDGGRAAKKPRSSLEDIGVGVGIAIGIAIQRPSIPIPIPTPKESGDWQVGTHDPGDCDCSHPLPSAIPIPQISRAPVKPASSRFRAWFLVAPPAVVTLPGRVEP